MHPGTPAASWLPEPAPQELCAFMSGVAAQILKTLQPRKTRPPRRKSTPRRFPYSPPYRSSAHCQDATQRWAREGPGPQARPRLPRPPSPFLGVAQALAAPESPGPGLALSAWDLQSPTHELAEIVPLGPGPSLLPAVTEDSSGFVQLPPDPSEPPLVTLPPMIADTQDPGPCPTMARGSRKGPLAVGTWVPSCGSPELSRPLLC
ncbi:uncharacterized protein C19orf85 homolog [Antechinus flavipes]|uniref:uncharacterized protein C19orf85 homolog n=1 Tax=Antechinus flavipes TaxID=38775 RepID=UPI002235904C|nr:uncharacterized protein C19orf85 homolog [Antechinus flavipes]